MEKTNLECDGAEKEGSETQDVLVSWPVISLPIGLSQRHRW